jgi:redox-sensitive bicupin YhaK (pirin superfamily)
VTVLCPSVEGANVSVEEVPTEGGKGRAVVVNRPDRHDLFLFATEGTVRLNGVEMDADAALVRRRSPQGEITALALFGATARLSVDGSSFRATDAAEAVRDGEGWEVRGIGAVAVSS